MKRILLFSTAAALVLTICGIAKGYDLDGRHFDDPQFNREQDDFRQVDPQRFDFYPDDFRRFDPWRFDRDQDDLRWFDSRQVDYSCFRQVHRQGTVK